MKTYGGMDAYVHVFLTSTLVGGEWSASRPSCFTPWESASTGPDWTTWRGEKYCPYRDSNSYPSAVQPVASRYTDCAIPALKKDQHRDRIQNVITVKLIWFATLSRNDVL
jgi:hypothetical protein